MVLNLSGKFNLDFLDFELPLKKIRMLGNIELAFLFDSKWEPMFVLSGLSVCFPVPEIPAMIYYSFSTTYSFVTCLVLLGTEICNIYWLTTLYAF